MRLGLCGLALVAVATASPAPAQTRAAVHVVGTGGTIGSSGDYWSGKATRVPIGDLLRIPGLDSVATVTSEQLWNVGSGSIGPAQWLQLSRHVAEVFGPPRIRRRAAEGRSC